MVLLLPLKDFAQMDFSLANILSIIIPFEALLFAIYILSLKVERRISNVFIALFIFDFGLENFMPVLYENVFIQYPQFALILDTLFFLQLPLIYLYIKSASFEDFKLRRIDLLHLLPLLIANLIITFQYHILPLETKKLIFQGGMRDLQSEMYLVFSLFVLQMIFYFALSLKAINKYRHIVNENYSDLGKYNYKWIQQLLSVFLFILVVSIIKNYAWPFIRIELHETISLAIKTSVLIFITWIIYMALKRPFLFSGVDSQMKLIKEILKEQEQRNRARSAGQISQKERELQKRLDQHMRNEKPFLDPALSLYDLSAQLDLPTRELSILINKYYKKHYFDFINSYRIELASKYLLDSDHKNLTVLEVMFDVGFNSKSSFNTAFKKHTKMTPTAYRIKHSLADL
jgi:AraC-like DNA-binding protein